TRRRIRLPAECWRIDQPEDTSAFYGIPRGVTRRKASNGDRIRTNIWRIYEESVTVWAVDRNSLLPGDFGARLACGECKVDRRDGVHYLPPGHADYQRGAYSGGMEAAGRADGLSRG